MLIFVKIIKKHFNMILLLYLKFIATKTKKSLKILKKRGFYDMISIAKKEIMKGNKNERYNNNGNRVKL